MLSSIGWSWAVTLWVPYALMGTLLSRQLEDNRVLIRDSSAGHNSQTKIVVGLHNAAVSAPQIMSALTCSLAYTATESGTQGDILSLLVGGSWTLVAVVVLVVSFEDLSRV